MKPLSAAAARGQRLVRAAVATGMSGSWDSDLLTWAPGASVACQVHSPASWQDYVLGIPQKATHPGVGDLRRSRAHAPAY